MHRTLTVVLALLTTLLLTPPVTAATRAADGPRLRVFVLAGQSNMEGQGVVDLLDHHHNGGCGTLVALAEDPRTPASTADLIAALRASDGSWRTRDDVFVHYTPDAPETAEGSPAKLGPLAFGFTPYLDGHHFGPEIGIGTVLGDAIDEPVLLVKTAWGGRSLFEDFRPPSSGGATGPCYRRMIEQVRAAVARAAEEFPAAKGLAPEISGFIWYHGWNDGCDPDRAVPAYESNLVNLIRDVRRDLGVADLPVVVGELTGPWVQAPGEWGDLRRAQRDATLRPEWNGRVAFVPTAAFVRDPDESPNPTHGHHEFGNAETYLLVGTALGQAMRSLVVPGAAAFVPTLPAAEAWTRRSGEMSGYLLVPTEPVPDAFNAGFSLYAAAWPILETYPGSRFQTGLFGTWMFAQFRTRSGKPPGVEPPADLYSDIEGGLGWWRDTRFATATPKFIMGGVAPNFSAWANGPGAGKGRDWDQPLGKYAVAQLSPWLLWPPDGLNLAQGTCGELFGYGYLPLPIVDAKATTDGAPIPTGDQCWTLFLSTENFRGPVAFFTPFFWSAAAKERRELAGMLLDSRPSDPNKAFQMETQWVPAEMAILAGGPGEGRTRSYARVAPMNFPVDADGRTVVLHRLTSYSRAALTDAVAAWFRGGPAPSGAFDAAGAHVQTFGDGGGSTWRIFADHTPERARREVDWSSFGQPVAHEPTTFGYRWNPELVGTVSDGVGGRVRLPEHFRLERRDEGPSRWVPVPAGEVPAESLLANVRFQRPVETGEGPYVTPDAPDSPFRRPGPVAGPFEATLGDGSVVTYSWYRFADQPAMLNADLTAAEREEAQRRAELIHRAWTRERTYIAPPTTGRLASIDPALIVTPPKGLEAGYVPIVTRQRGTRN